MKVVLLQIICCVQHYIDGVKVSRIIRQCYFDTSTDYWAYRR